MNNKYTGFTLIELLVVIAIIGILVTAGLASYATAREQARDARRAEDMHNIQTTLEQHYTINSQYPEAADINTAFEGDMPADPLSGDPYNIDISTTAYCICAQMETRPGNSADPDCNSWDNTGEYFCVENQQ